MTRRRAMAGAIVALAVFVPISAWVWDAQIAAYVLSGGLLAFGMARLLLPDRDVLTARGRLFDVSVLLLLALAIAILAPLGLAQLPN